VKRYSHVFEIAFEADSNSQNPDEVTAEELLAGLRRRAANLATCGEEIKEAVVAGEETPVDRKSDALGDTALAPPIGLKD
jgi:hypothetical protein